MKLRLLIGAVVLTIGFGLGSPAISQSACDPGQTTPSCGCYDPGQTSTPPCAAPQQATDVIAPGQTQTPPAADTVDVISDIEVALIELLILW